ncbi:hypothetical protein BDZ94DRAFT_1242629 [Collybia nuda]|uniref:Uncharacterized protein n=1 Tax=Collybia nuda TaxID=64659 RepID=A0A9P5YHU2_9AGAR|nr:hypothetical protein BDZ94DRAFT_1242629 [Collybia nuda]
MTFRPITLPPKDLDSLTKIQSSLVLPRFNSDDAWTIGNRLRSRLVEHSTPAVISILLASTPVPRVLFHTTTRPGTNPDNDIWVARKARTAFRFGVSSYYMGRKFSMNDTEFATKYGIGPEEVSGYAIHGGAVPIRVKDVEGVVAVIVVSGLSQEEDHGVIVEILEQYSKGQDS